MSEHPKNPRGEQRIITDFGHTLEVVDGLTGEQLPDLPRYGVWGRVDGKSQVLETHHDLARLQRDHGVPDQRVVPVTRGTNSAPKTARDQESDSAIAQSVYRVSIQRHHSDRPGDDTEAVVASADWTRQSFVEDAYRFGINKVQWAREPSGTATNMFFASEPTQDEDGRTSWYSLDVLAVDGHEPSAADYLYLAARLGADLHPRAEAASEPQDDPAP